MAVATNWGPPSIAGSINEGVDSILGGIQDYRLGQELQNMPKTADGSPDFQAMALRLMRSNPAAAQRMMAMEEMRQRRSYQDRYLANQERQTDIAADKSTNIQAEGKIFHIGPNGQLKGTTDVETGAFTPAGGAAAAQPAAPREPPPEAIELLKKEPHRAAQFEKHYGLPPGSSQQYLGGGQPVPAAPAPAAAAPAPVAAAPAQAQAVPPSMRRMPGESYSAWKAREKKMAEERGTIDNPELKKADDAIQSGRNTLTTIGEMVELNKSAFHGPLAQQRGHLASLTGIGGKQAGADTVVLQNKITGGALEQLRATFGGNPTEGERAILLQVQGSVGQAADVRARIFKDAADLVRRRIKYNQKYANAVRSGNLQLMPDYTDNTPVD